MIVPKKYLRFNGEGDGDPGDGEISVTDYVGTNPDINGHNLLYFQALPY